MEDKKVPCEYMICEGWNDLAHMWWVGMLPPHSIPGLKTYLDWHSLRGIDLLLDSRHFQRMVDKGWLTKDVFTR